MKLLVTYDPKDVDDAVRFLRLAAAELEWAGATGKTTYPVKMNNGEGRVALWTPDY